MVFSANHSIQKGDIISSYDEQIAVAVEYEVSQTAINQSRPNWVKVADATIRISAFGDCLVTNSYAFRDKGLLCILPPEFKGCGILSVKVTYIGNKSVKAIPTDYIKFTKPFEWHIEHGKTAQEILNDKDNYPDAKRIKVN